MDFFSTLELIVTAQSPDEKIAAFRTFYDAYKNGAVRMEPGSPARRFEAPSYAPFCRIVAPQAVPKRKKIAQREGQVLLLHAIAHIEYSAIDLALDAAYRFRQMPKAFYDDWLEVADDEVRHFGMIAYLLEELGSGYGEVAVHNALFEASQRTQTLLERMAVVPRFLEANGLDATPEIVQKLQPFAGDPFIGKIMAALDVIVKEEVDHVRKGDRWFAYACEKEGVEKSVYFEIIERHYPGSFPRKKQINARARMDAGFSCSELNTISRDQIC